MLKRRDHAIRIETAIRKVDLSIDAKLQLSALLRSRRVDPCVSEALEVILTLIGINNVNGLVATLESIFYEWEQDAILFVGAVEESADVTVWSSWEPAKGMGAVLFFIAYPPGYRVAPQLSSIMMHHSAPKCPTHTLVWVDTFVQ